VMAPIGSITTPSRFGAVIGSNYAHRRREYVCPGAARRWTPPTTFEKRDVHGIAGGVPIC
jgi:hypothetical protein